MRGPRTVPTGRPPAPTLGPLTDHGREVAAEAAVGRTVRQSTPPAAGTPPPAKAVARHLGEARRLHAAGRIEAAIPLLQQAALLDPANPRIRHDVGVALLDRGRPGEAAASFRHAIRLDPRLATAHHHLGIALSRQGKVSEATAAYRAAVAIAPKLADAWFQLGVLLRERGQTGQAAEAYEKAAAAEAGTTKGRMAAAYALLARNCPEEAMTLLRRAGALDPKATEVVRLLATTLIEAGRFGEAEEQLAQALALHPADAAAWHDLATLRRMTPADRPLMARIVALLQAGGIAERDRVLLHFALGKAHDDLREFEAAIGHFDAANRIRSATAPLDRKAVTRFVDRAIELFPRGAGTFDAALGVDDERPVFILGLPRSGTTLVEQILSNHPAVAAGGELGFWGQHGAPVLAAAAGPITRASLHELAAGYQAVLRGIAVDAARVTDKNPFNFLYIGLLRLAFPRAAIIHCRRHPVDTCLSIYTTSLSARDLAFMGNREDLVFYYGEYARLMRHWREALPPARFVEIDYEALVADREAQTRRLVAACGLEWHHACLRPEGNRRAIATASRWQARQPVYGSSVGRWRNYRPWLGPLADLLPPEDRT